MWSWRRYVKLNTICEAEDAECNNLRQVNCNLVSQIIESPTVKLTKRPGEFSQRPTLLIGDSLIRDIDQTKLEKTVVKSKSGAKIKDIAGKLSQDNNKCKKIIVCVGTNNCSEILDIDTLTQHINELLEIAAERVSCVADIVKSSIPPRTDNIDRQFEELNTIIQDISTKTGAHYTYQMTSRSV